MSSNPKRVSFGSHGSMVETLIINIDPDDFSPQERLFYERNRLVRTSDQALYQKPADHNESTSFCRCRHTSVTGTENPFSVNGELRRKADLILSKSRISRTDLCIVDPDISDSSSPSAVAVAAVTAENPDKTDQSPSPYRSTPSTSAKRPPCILKNSRSAPETVAPVDELRPEIGPTLTADESNFSADGNSVRHRETNNGSARTALLTTTSAITTEGRVELTTVPVAQLQRAEEVRLVADRSGSGCLPRSSRLRPSSSACSRCAVS